MIMFKPLKFYHKPGAVNRAKIQDVHPIKKTPVLTKSEMSVDDVGIFIAAIGF